MSLKNPCSRVGAGDESGVGDGEAVCARAPIVATSAIRTVMPKWQSDLPLLRMLLPPGKLVVSYLLTTRTTNEPGFMVRCGRPPGVLAGVSVYSAALRKIFLVFGSKAIVRALGIVLTGPTSS